MALCLIASEDANVLMNKLKTSLQSMVETIDTLPPQNALKPERTVDRKIVRVLFLTALSWQKIQTFSKSDLNTLFSNPKKSIVLCSCTKSVKSDAVKLFEKSVDSWEAFTVFDASGEEWYIAEARIKIRLSELENGEVMIPQASQFIIKPDTVSLTSQAEVLIILLDSNQTSEVETLQIKVDAKSIEAKQIQSKVWSFDPSGLMPGEHEFQVFANDLDLGTNTLCIEDRHAMVRRELGKLIQEEPKRFLAELLCLNVVDFDHDLKDYIHDSSSISVLEKLFQYSTGEDEECLSFQEFCSKNGITSTNKPVRTEPPPVQRRSEPVQDEEFTPLSSTFKGSARDSGHSSYSGSGGSIGERGRRNSKPEEPKNFRFKRPNHSYDQISDEEDNGSNDPYNRPWDHKTLMPNRSGKAWASSESFSKSLEDSSTVPASQRPHAIHRWSKDGRDSTNM